MPRYSATIFNVAGMQCKPIEYLGSGTFGCVLLAKTTDIHLPFVALKALNNRNSANLEFKIHNFLAKRDRKGFIPHMFGISRTQNVSMICMEYVSKGSLLEAAKKDNGLSEDSIKIYFNQVINGLQFIHKHGVVHRDIKLDNLLISASNALKISDFGLAQRYRTNGGEILVCGAVGTEVNWPPEASKVEKVRGPPLDIYAAGYVLLDMFARFAKRNMTEQGYHQWREHTIFSGNLRSIIPADALSLLLNILVPVERRANIFQIKDHPWLNQLH